MGQEGRGVVFRGCEVPADDAEVGVEAPVGPGATGDEVVHPGPLALLLPGKPVGIEGTETRPVLVDQLVVADVGVPYLFGLPFGGGDAEDPPDDLEESFLDPVQGEVRTEELVVDFEAGY